MPFFRPRLFTRHRVTADDLIARCAAADQLVALRVATLARAAARHVAEPDSREAFAALEAAEELLFLAEHEQRRARAARRRAGVRATGAGAADERARTTESSP